ncbi:MAG: sulfatase-like hydrolase/transferase [Desulfobacteraceae bacterium]|nr:sulfatase-like hydrolase/transferase [Desulfobacteraceae bacterium]
MIDDLDLNLFQLMLKNKKLPNIDKHIVNRGIQFSNFFATDAICCPSRATFLTGQYVQNHGITNITQGYELIYPNDPTGQDGDKTFLQNWLKEKNYTTGLVGKYLNAYAADPAKPEGWDYWVALFGHSSYKMTEYTYIDNDGSIPDPEQNTLFQTDFIAEKGIDFIENQVESNKPFFLYMAPTAPHTNMPYQPGDGFGRPIPYSLTYAATLQPYPDFPLNESPDLVRKENFFKIDGKSTWITDNIDTEHVNLYYKGINNYYKSRYSNMRGIDKMVGNVVNALEKKGLYDDTVIVFLSDNGFYMGEFGLTQKGAPYEEAIRVPLVIAVPNTDESLKGKTSDALVLNNDLAVTIADMASVVPLRETDGQSMVPLFSTTNGDTSLKSFPRKRFLVRFYQEATGLEALDIIPEFQALRTLTPNENSLYVNYGKEHKIINGETDINGSYTEATEIKDAIEYYDINLDKYQLNNFYDQLPPLMEKQYSKTLNNFKTCKGDDCHFYENNIQSDLNH